MPTLDELLAGITTLLLIGCSVNWRVKLRRKLLHITLGCSVLARIILEYCWYTKCGALTQAGATCP